VRSDQSFLALTNARYKAGQVTKLEVFNAEVQLHADELTVVNDAGALELAFDRLKELLDLDLREALRVDAPVVDFGEKELPDGDMVISSNEATGTVYLQKVLKDGPPVGEQTVLFRATHFDESVVLQEALNNRLDLLNARRALAVQKLQALLNKDGLGHQIDLVGSLGRTTTGRSIFEADNYMESNAWSVGLSATFPWGKIRDRAAYERALLALEKAEIDLKLANTAVQADVRNTLRTLRTFEKGSLIGGQQVEQAKLAEKAAKVSFDRGLKDSFNVIQAEQALLAAKRNFVNTTLDYTVQLAQLELSVGKPTGRVNLKGDSVGGMVESRLPESLRNRELPKPAPNAEPRPEDDPFSRTPEYRKDYKADKDKILIEKPAD
jgi:outer membrane protein TolC